MEPPLDDFVGFGTKKTKKAGKKITEVVEDPIFAVVPEPEPEADIGGWGSFGKKDKRKGSKKESEKVEEVITALPEPEPEADAGGWGSFGKKEKKKAGKKEEKVDDPIFAVVGEPEAEIGGWGSFGKKDKNKAGKKEEKIDDPIIAVVDVPEAEIGGWGSLGKKDKKKAGKKDADKASEPDVTKVVEPEAKPDDDWGGFGAKTEKKKKKKSVFDEPEKEELIVEEKAEHEPGFEPEPAAETGWGAFGSKKKKAGKKDVLENKPPPPPDPEPVVEEKPALSSTGSKKDKKGKKGLISEVKEDPIVAVDSKSVADATSVAGEDDWGSNWGATDKKKDKKSKRNSIASSAGTKEDAALPPPPVPDVPNASSFDIWGSASKKDKDKKGKKGKAAEPETEFLPDQEPDVSKDFLDDDFGAGTWGLSAKDKKKKEKELEKKKQAKAEEEEKAKQEEEEKVSKEEDEWAASIMGLSVKERKKKERERDKAKKDKEEKEQRAKEDEEARQKEEEEERVRKEEEEKAAEEEAKTIKKGKLGKKGKTTTSPEVSKTKDLLADSVPDTDPLVDTDTWGSSWGVGQKDKKKGSQKAMDFKVPPAAPTPPTQGLTPDAEEDDPIVDWGDFGTTTNSKSKRDAKKGSKVEDSKASKKGAKDKIDEGIEDKKLPKEETPAKAAKSFWGGMGATTSSKPKTAKEDKKAKEADFEDEEEDLDEIIEILDNDPPRKKSSKDKIGSKLSKTATKESDKANKSSDAKKKGIADEADDAPAAKGKDGKSKGVDKKDQDDGPKEDTLVSSLWGSSSKKTSGKKADEVKKEIGKQDSANQKASLKKGAAWNEPEAAREESDDQPPNPQPATKTSKSAMSTTKSTKLSPVQQKIRDLEKKRQEAAGESPPPPPPPPPAADPEPSSKLDKKGAKLKDSASKTASSKTKDLSPVERKKGFKDSVPGSFPGMDDLDDLMEMDSPSLEKKENKKSTKSSIKESTKTSKTRETPESKRLPTPPPEPKEGKPVKKERARVSKSLWGAPVVKKEVKKETKTKDDADVSLPPKKEKVAAAGLSRSKSTRTTTKEKETARSDPKSSDYDKVEDKVEKPKKADSRPPKSRGSSFGGLFGGGPPKRTTPTRRNSAISGPKTASRRQSIDVGDSGLPSPPIDDAPVSGKAAKLMGTGAGKLDRKASTRGKQKVSGSDLKAVLKQSENAANNGGTAAPDPYAIDSDDMVMVNPVEDPILNAQPLKKGLKSKSKNDVGPEHASLTRDLPDRSRPKRDSKMEPTSSKRKSKAVNDFEDDVVMVDAGPSDGPDVADGPDDMQFITKPKGLQRSATSAKKPESKKGGLFGAFRKSRRASETNERPKSRAVVEDEEVAPRKRTVTGGDDSAKRPRRDDRRRSEKVSSRAAEGYVYDTAGDAGATEAEDADARREERRSKRVEKDRAAKEAQEEALKYEAERRTKRREAEKSKAKDERDRKARKEEEAEARRQEEKDSRRAAREARRAKEEEQANRELEDDILKPRTKRRDNDKEISSRPGRSDRRRSHMDKPIPSSQTPDEEEARRLRREERRVKPSRRKSTAAAPVEDYFDPRNGGNNPYSENDHTASWLKSQVSEPPEPPPVEPTILETLPDLRAGNGGEDLLAEENLRRSSHRKSKRSSRMYTDPVLEDQETKTRRREGRRGDADGRGIRSSDGSAEGERYGMSRRQSDLGGVKLGTGTKTFDGRTGQGKRASWFQKITGM